MRSAVLTAGDDLGFEAGPRRRAPAKARRSSSRRKATGKARRQWLHKATRYAAIGCSALVVVGILVNALLLQKGHHPAPLFATSTKVRSVDPAPRTAALATPQPQAAAAPAPVVPPDPTPAPAPAVSPAAAAPAPAMTKDRSGSTNPPHDDAIARLLAGEAPVRTSAAASHDGTKPPIGAVQKALARLGFPAGNSGHLDAATRKALERYQVSRHLPTKDPLGTRTLKSLGINQ